MTLHHGFYNFQEELNSDLQNEGNFFGYEIFMFLLLKLILICHYISIKIFHQIGRIQIIQFMDQL